MLSTLVNIVAAPRLAFQHLHKAPSVLLPMLLLVAAVGVVNFAYFELSDSELLIEDLLDQAGGNLSDAERDEARQNYQGMSGSTLKWVSVLGGILGTVFIFVVQAGYYYLVSMFNGTKIGYKPWLSFVAWSSVPLLFSLVASMATLLLATGHTSLTNLNPFTLVNLVGIDSKSTQLPNTLKSFDLTRLWSIALMLIGYRIWTDKSWLHCSLVVLLPMVVVYGAMFAFGV